ncbi:MAG: hypothetical protein HRU09_06710 [Oligoflexales bacterium]|nr:hypothetical protein [Oligoflexales bacterium]
MSSVEPLKKELDKQTLMKIKDALLRMIRYHSKKCLEGYIFTEVEEEETAVREIPIYGFWLSFVLLATDYMNIILKTHFDFSSILPILKKIFNTKDIEISQQMAESFMNEYSNLFGTKIKNSIYEIGIPAGMSLPVLTRGFDNYLFEEYFKSSANISNAGSSNKKRETYQYSKVWKFTTDETTIFCSVEIDIMSLLAFEKLEPLLKWDPKKNAEEKTDKMEFLL